MRRLKLLAAALALALSVPAAVAATGGDDEILLLDLCLNDRCSGVAVVAVRGERILIDREALLAAGLDPTGLRAERLGGRDLVDPVDLAAGIVVQLDRGQLRVDLRQDAADMARQRVDLRQRPRIEPVGLPWSTFANYAARFGDRGGSGDARRDGSPGLESLFVDAAIGRGHVALRSTAFWGEGGGWRRGLTRLEIDQTQRLRRWTVGDQSALARDPLGGGALLGGVGVERAFDQDPYLVTFPQPFHTGMLQAPGTVEVYANGALIARRDLNAGPFTLDNLGVPPGRSDLRIVVRDPFGNRSELASTYFYGTSSLLAPGLSDYAFRLGRIRRDVGFGDARYGDGTALQAWYRYGVGPALTVGGRIEGDAGLRNAGIEVAFKLPLGEVGASVGASDDRDAGRGDAGSLTYTYGGPRFGFGFGARRFDGAYRRLGDADNVFLFGGRVRDDDFASISLAPFERLSLQLNYARQRREDWPRERSIGLAATWRLSGRAQMLLSVQQRRGGMLDEPDTAGVLSFTYAFDRSSVGADIRHDAGGTGYGINARRSRQQDLDWGYDLDLQHSPDYDSGRAQLEYQGPHGRYALQAERFGGDSSMGLLVSGALVGIGGRVYATPPLESGFALVRVRGVAGVPVLRENVEAGRTDGAGDLLVRGLVPYSANRIAVDGAGVPMQYDIVTGQREITVPRNTGAIVDLDVRALRAVTGHVRLPSDNAPVSTFGILRLSGGGDVFEAPLGGSGRYYFEDLPPGRYRAEVERAGAVIARCVLEVPGLREAGIAPLGDLVCGPGGTEGVQP